MDKITSERRSANMRAIRSKDTLPELFVRRLIHGMGYRYRLHSKRLPGKPDLTFPKYKKVIFVHGCFWHQHGDPSCADARKPKSNSDYWQEKLALNVSRDRSHIENLTSAGWKVLVIWDCETKRPDQLRARIIRFLAA